MSPMLLIIPLGLFCGESSFSIMWVLWNTPSTIQVDIQVTYLLCICLTAFAEVEYAHLPDVNTFNGLLDLLSACILAILGNVLDFRTYSAANQGENKPISGPQKVLMAKYDRNDIPRNERMAICYVRGVALSLFDWVRSQFIITAPDGKILHDLPSQFLIQVLNALITYKSRAMRMKIKGAPHCDTTVLRKQITNVVRCDSRVESLWRNKAGKIEDKLAFDGEGYLMQRKAGPITKKLDPSKLSLSTPAMYNLIHVCRSIIAERNDPI
jgi:hypothetical protein